MGIVARFALPVDTENGLEAAMAYKLLIIRPSYYRSKGDRTIVRLHRREVVPLALPYLAALTPDGWEVTLVDEMLADVDFDAGVDLVAITTWTLSSYHAYDLAAEFRKRGKPVLLGGPHVYFHPEEAAAHADAVGVGEGEVIWRLMLADAAAGRLKSIYRAPSHSDLRGLPFPRYDLLDLKPYGRIKTFAVQSTRGCPFMCDFCSERLYLGAGFRWRPVEDVVSEIRRLPSRYVFFAESNFGGKRNYAMQLMEAVLPLKLRWSTLWSLNLCADTEFLDLAQRSGLLHVNIGMESVDADTIAGMKKRQNKVHQYQAILADLRRRGISYSLNFIFGWDTESKAVFRATLGFLREQRVPAAFFNVLTPEKGTAYFTRMQDEGRIFNADEIGRWPGEHCHIRPSYCTPQELEDSVQQLYREFYSLPSMLSRLPLPLTQASIASWVLNFSQRHMVQAALENRNFDTF
jgi:radical SAM superfamily enzyme YgiQ (UPF0313 family)